MMWTDDGFVVRFPETDDAAGHRAACCRRPTRSRRWSCGSSARARSSPRRFREVAARALLLPRRRAGRTRAAVAAAEARGRPARGRGTLRLVPGAARDLPRVPARRLRPAGARRHPPPGRHAQPSTWSPSIRRCLRRSRPRCCSATSPTSSTTAMRRWPSAGRRRSRWITAQLRELLGDAELRELLDPAVDRRLRTAAAAPRCALPREECGCRARSADPHRRSLARPRSRRGPPLADVARCVCATLARSRRIVRVPIAGGPRYIAAEDAARYRDALGAPLPQGLPERSCSRCGTPLGIWSPRYARTHGPFTTDECARRFGLGHAVAGEVLGADRGGGPRAGRRVPPGRRAPRVVRRRACSARCGSDRWRGCGAKSSRSRPTRSGDSRPCGRASCGRVAGLDALLDAIEQLQGAPLPVSVLEPEVLPGARRGLSPRRPRPPHGERARSCGWASNRSAIATAASRCTSPITCAPWCRPSTPSSGRGSRQPSLEHLQAAGASFFPAIHAACGGGFPQDVVDALWDLVWGGVVTNDTFHAVRAFVAPPARTRRDRQARGFRSRRAAPPEAQGRWSLVAPRVGERPSSTEWATGIARQLLNRHGILTREAVAAEGLRGGFSTVYEVLKTMEESGRIRRGLFVGGLGAMQFALPAALDLLRSVRDEPESPQVAHLAATDPANPYGAILKWPTPPGAPREGRGPTRTAGATVILVNGRLAAYLARGDRHLSVYLPDAEPTRTNTARAVASRLFQLATAAGGATRHAHRAGGRGGRRRASARALSRGGGVRPRRDGVAGERR